MGGIFAVGMVAGAATAMVLLLCFLVWERHRKTKSDEQQEEAYERERARNYIQNEGAGRDVNLKEKRETGTTAPERHRSVRGAEGEEEETATAFLRTSTLGYRQKRQQKEEAEEEVQTPQTTTRGGPRGHCITAPQIPYLTTTKFQKEEQRENRGDPNHHHEVAPPWYDYYLKRENRRQPEEEEDYEEEDAYDEE